MYSNKREALCQRFPYKLPVIFRFVASSTTRSIVTRIRARRREEKMDPPLLNRRQLIGEAGRRPTDENFRYRDAWNYLCDSYPLASSAFCPFCFVPSMGRRRGGRREAGGTMAKLRWPRDGRGGTWQVSRDEVCGYVRYEKRYKTKRRTLKWL